MKKFYYAIVCLSLMIAGTSMMTSCDDDTMDSIYLSGEWYGDMGMYIDLDHNLMTHDDHFDASKTWIAFHQDHDWSTHGWGEEIDYFDDGPYYYQNLYFEWKIRDQVLYLTYPHEPDLNIAISDYNFSKSYTQLDFTINKQYKCVLYKTVDYQDAWYYWKHEEHLDFNKYDYWWYKSRPSYYAKGRDGKVEKSVDIKPEDIKMGRDFSKFEQVNP